MRYLIFFLVATFFSCTSESSQNQLLVVFPQTTLRDAPGLRSKETGVLKQGDRLTDLHETSGFESALSLDDRLLQSPWIRVKTGDRQTGWVFCEAVRPVQKNAGWMLQQRMRCYFGDALTLRRNRYPENAAIENQEQFAARYREAMALRDTLMYVLARRAEPVETGFQPDFSWLGEVLPGFIYQSVGNGTRPYLFCDYRFWNQQAHRTAGGEAVAFLNVCLSAFAADSIESPFPDWKFRITEEKSASQLGTGRHLAMLKALQSASEAGSLFKPELAAFKESLLEDILGTKTEYWQPKELIIKELNEILEQNFSCLDARDRAALQARLMMFEDPEANGLQVNLRSGE